MPEQIQQPPPIHKPLGKELSLVVGSINLVSIISEILFFITAFLYLTVLDNTLKAIAFSVLACAVKYLFTIKRTY